MCVGVTEFEKAALPGMFFDINRYCHRVVCGVLVAGNRDYLCLEGVTTDRGTGSIPVELQVGGIAGAAVKQPGSALTVIIAVSTSNNVIVAIAVEVTDIEILAESASQRSREKLVHILINQRPRAQSYQASIFFTDQLHWATFVLDRIRPE